VDLIEPRTRGEMADAVRDAAASGLRMVPVGGRTHLARGEPAEVDAELATTSLDRLVAYEPAEMIAVVEAGMRFGELSRIVGAAGQEWPVDAPEEATVGGVIASGASSPRRLRVGPVRDTVLEVELITGDGRPVRGGGRTVKNVTGFDIPRLMTGSLGTLGILVQVALKLRPVPAARRLLVVEGSVETADRALAEVPLPAAILTTLTRVEILLEGWPEAMEEQTARARSLGETRAIDDADFPNHSPWSKHPVVVEASVPPSRLRELTAAAGEDWGALAGVGTLWAGLASANGELSSLRARAAELGGVSPVIRGPGGLGGMPTAERIHRRLKAVFDPAGVLAPGRFWGGI
jgi:glycolate oxidase FAD binding subunit